MTLDKYIYEIRHLIGDRATYIDDRLIIRWININRVNWIKNEVSKNNLNLEYYKQTIPFLELEVVDQSIIPFIPTSNRILRTIDEIPRVLSLRNKAAVLSVGNSKVISERYNFVTREQAIYSGSGKLNTKDIFVFLYNDYLYVKLKKENPKISMLTHLSLDAIFEDPTEVENFNNVNNTPCYDVRKDDYPITDNMWVYMREQIVNLGNLSVISNLNEEKAQS